MKHKRMWVILGVVVTIVILAVGWFKWPVRLTKVDASEVGLIVLLDGNTGNRVEISDTETIDILMEEFRSVKMQRERLSAFSGGYHIWVRICKPDMEIVSDFTINGNDYIKKDPFFYTISKESIDVEYLEQLIEKAQDTEE